MVLTLDGQPVPLDATGTGHITAGQPGKKTLQAVATDQDGITGTTTLQFKVRDPNDLTPPVVALDPRLGQAAVASVANVLGTVADTNLDFWTLELAPLGSDNFVKIAGGEAPVAGGVLTTIDPGTLANGFYRLRLTAADIAGRHSVTEEDFEVHSTKPSAILLTDTDLTVTLGGTTVSLTRAYDSAPPASQDTFGTGWRLVNRDVNIQVGLAPTGREALGV